MVCTISYYLIMEIKFDKCNCIITPLSPELGKRETDKIAAELDLLSNCRIGIDLSFVKDCSSYFLDFIYNCKNINLFNIPSNIFVLLNCMNLDKAANLFVSEYDFLNSSHRLLNRRFSVVN